MTTATQELTFHSQYGEDKLLWQMFRGRRHGFFIDVGAYNGVEFSNTCFLERQGWQGIIIEPHRGLFDQAVPERLRSMAFNAACSSPDHRGEMTFTEVEGCPLLSFLHREEDHVARCVREGRTLVETKVQVRTLDEMLDEARSRAWDEPSPWSAEKGWAIDVVSIDVEGGELNVLKGFDLVRHKPKVLIVECDRPSALNVMPHLTSHGYFRVHRQCINDFYVHRDWLHIESLGADKARVQLRL